MRPDRDHAPEVVVVSGSFRTGGAEISSIRLANGLFADGVNVELLVVVNEGDCRSLVAPGLPVHTLPHRRARYGFFALWNWLRKKKPAVIICSQNHVHAMVVLASRFLSSPPKVIVNEHSPPSMHKPHGRISDARRWRSWIYRHADMVVAVSEGIRSDVLSTYNRLPEQKTWVIPNAIEMEEKDSGSDLLSSFTTDGPLILTACRLAPEKDIGLLLQAFYQVTRTQPARLLVLGDGPERPRLEEWVRSRDLTSRVIFAGARTDVQSCMRQADLYVMSSRYEGLPVALLEALMNGCPAVSTDCNHGPAEIQQQVGEEALTLVPVGDAEAMAEAIRQRLSHPRATVDVARLAPYRPTEVVSAYRELIRRLRPDSRRLDVLCLGPVPPPVGGVSVHLVRVLQQSSSEKVSVALMDLHGRKIYFPDGRVGGWWSCVRALFSARTYHLHGVRWEKALLLLGARLIGKSTVLTLHNPRGWYSPVNRLCRSLADQVITVFSAPVDAGTTDSSKYKVIPAYISPPDFSFPYFRFGQEILSNQEKSEGEKTIVVLSTRVNEMRDREEDVYGLDLALEAARQSDRLPFPLHWILIDVNGKMESRYRHDVEALRAKGNRLTYIRESVDMLRLLRRTDVLLRPTRSDGDAVSIREAISMGVSVVASDASSRPKGVHVFPSGDVHALVRVLQEVLTTPAAVERSAPDFAAPLFAVYRKLLSR